MMNRTYCLLFILAAVQVLSAASVTRQFHGIRPTDPSGREALANPERGFRWENRFGSNLSKWADSRWTGSIRACSDDGLTMTQGYCELIDYAQASAIPEDQIKRLEDSFRALREHGIKVQLCFRYEMRSSDQGPTAETILSHIRQLKPILRRNMDVIAVFQAGFVGLYGEWHRSTHKIDQDPRAQERIMNALLDVVPHDRKLLMRYPRHKNVFMMRTRKRKSYVPITSSEAHCEFPEARLGFCDHGFMVGRNDAGTFAPRPSVDYDYMTQESLFVPMDGELFWVWNRPYGIAKDDGLEAIRRLWEHHYTFFSYAHNHSRYEDRRWKQELGARYSIDEWKDDQVSADYLAEHSLPFDAAYFQDASGKPVTRSIFDYIRDHLGYRLALTHGTFPTTMSAGGVVDARFTLTNHGFAAPINPRPVHLVLMDGDTPVVIGRAGCDVRRWYPCDPENRQKLRPAYEVSFHGRVPGHLSSGLYRLGIWLPDGYASLRNDPRYSIRLANGGLSFAGGVNVIGKVTVK